MPRIFSWHFCAYYHIHLGTMYLKEYKEAYQILKKCADNISTRNDLFKIRKSILDQSSPIIKVAFDTRRIDEETQYNPRRGLQNYHRSEAFITEATSEKLKNFSKLKKVLDSLKDEFGKEKEWQDSYARVLLSTLEKGLRTEQKDGDFTDTQPGVGSFDYIEELLYVRYRLTNDGIGKLSHDELKKIILDKDEELTKKDSTQQKEMANIEVEIKKNDITNNVYESLLQKLFGGISASKENPNVERSITIVIKDSILEKKEEPKKEEPKQEEEK